MSLYTIKHKNKNIFKKQNKKCWHLITNALCVVAGQTRGDFKIIKIKDK